MDDKSESCRGVVAKAKRTPLPEAPVLSHQEELLDEALKETFPASDPTSVYRLD